MAIPLCLIVIQFHHIAKFEEVCCGIYLWKFDPFIEQLSAYKWSNSYLKLTICAKREIFSIFYEEIGGGNSEMEKWGKNYDQGSVYCELICCIFNVFPHL